MFHFFKKNHPPQQSSTTLTFYITGMHCTSCALNIDGALEDMPGLITAYTRYAQSCTTVTFDPKQTNKESVQSTLEELGYKVMRVE